MSDTLIVVRGAFSIEDPWATPPSCETVRLRRAIDGQAPRLATTVSAYFDSRYLNLVFSAADDYVVASFTDRDDPIYEEDVVEVFLAPDQLSRYFEIEVSPVGTLFDAQIDSPDGIRDTMRADVSWTPEGLLAGVRKIVEPGLRMTIDTTLRIPFRSLGRSEPCDGETWRANFFRIDRHPAEGDEYSAWRPTMCDPADFHVTSAFGSLKFRV
ncbi:MAG: carbohydrate-binding family 9-like protein [Thermoanaerobaculia bacterium]|nr:carbohydrate-binding family 9-like protein [Thermoanaerobaculia bacterium]